MTASRPSEHPPVRGEKCQNVQVFSFMYIYCFDTLEYIYIFRISSSNNIQSKEYSSMGLVVKNQGDVNGHFLGRQIDERWLLCACLANSTSMKLENTSFTKI